MKTMNLQKIGILILLCFLNQLQAKEKGHYHNLTKALQNPMDVRTLDLRDNQLTNFPKEIGNLKELRELYLSDNQLKTIPKEIGNLQKLQALYLKNNKLITLPNEIGKLQKLHTLNSYDIPALKSQEKKIQKLIPKASIDFIDIKR
ncbi:leucine-rich repeat domain-containing protein [Leptospira noguchii]|uniref:Leucine rich repeat protein n=1 Tax=Leptospira noguchii serovar Panama str. CZ214 TaxID=1001595 RepID=T0FPQ4_9LEPT|nr:leucine-rich repeat domain-containing protein [Leptospira noguchii]EQA71560.1 leucine rich repeat protein [Leptospira noguchii serovar Panama str. CZ214]